MIPPHLPVIVKGRGEAWGRNGGGLVGSIMSPSPPRHARVQRRKRWGKKRVNTGYGREREEQEEEEEEEEEGEEEVWREGDIPDDKPPRS